jgi:hypothetical protein
MGRYCEGVGGEVNRTWTEMKGLCIEMMPPFLLRLFMNCLVLLHLGLTPGLLGQATSMALYLHILL